MKRRDLLSKAPAAALAAGAVALPVAAKATPRNLGKMTVQITGTKAFTEGLKEAYQRGLSEGRYDRHEIEYMPLHQGFYITAVRGDERMITFVHDTVMTRDALQAACESTSRALDAASKEREQ